MKKRKKKALSKEYDPETGVTTEHFFEGNRMTIRRTQDVEPVIDEATAVRNMGRNGFSEDRHFRKIGSIPLMVVDKVLRERGINLMENSEEARKESRKILNEYNKFRTVDKPV